MDNQNTTWRKVDRYFWGDDKNRGKIGDMDSYSRATVHKGWHSLNCAVTAVKETVTGKWDYKGTQYEAGRVAYHNQQQRKGLSPFRNK